jgi:hypothetical protein
MLIQRKTIKHPHIKRSHSFRIFGCLIATCALPTATLAADNLGAHEHGQAQLQMALENSQIDLLFTSPAYNLAGFEHQARTGDEKKRLADINHWLETTPLINTDTGSCSVTAATVELGGETESHDEHSHHDENHHDEEHHSDDEHHSGEKRDDEASHRDYEVAQQLTCKGMGTGEIFTSPLPGRFPELQELTIEWVDPTGQGSTLITPSSPSFTLSE